MPPETTPRQHAYTGPPMPVIEEPSHAERVRTLVSIYDTGTLSTWSKRVEGFPFGSLMPFALDGHGRPLFLISNMAMHTQNLKADARASLFVEQHAVNGDPLGRARATFVGLVEPVGVEDRNEARSAYLERHPKSGYWVDFADFSFFSLQPVEIYYVGGFGVMGWVTAEFYAAASPDPLAQASAGILSHMNADHVEAMLKLAANYARITAIQATMTSVDRLGFTLRLITPDGTKGIRINFPQEVATPAEARTVLVGMVRS